MFFGPERPKPKREKELKSPLLENETKENQPPLPINSLLHLIQTDTRRVTEAFKSVVKKIIEDTGGLLPEIEFLGVETQYGGFIPRMIARFQTSVFSLEQ